MTEDTLVEIRVSTANRRHAASNPAFLTFYLSGACVTDCKSAW